MTMIGPPIRLRECSPLEKSAQFPLTDSLSRDGLPFPEETWTILRRPRCRLNCPLEDQRRWKEFCPTSFLAKYFYKGKWVRREAIALKVFLPSYQGSASRATRARRAPA